MWNIQYACLIQLIMKEIVDGTERAVVYLYGTTKDGEGIAVRTPLNASLFSSS